MKNFKILLGLIIVVTFMFSLAACKEKITITVAQNDITLKETQEEVLNYETNDAEGVTFVSSDTEIVTVNEDGEILGIKTGTATITITSKTNTSISENVNVTVEACITITGANAVVIDETLELTATVSEHVDNQNVTWSSSDENIVTIDENGKVTAVSVGSVVITATSVANNEITATHELSVVLPSATGVTIAGNDSPTYIGATITLTAIVKPDLASGEVVWSSSDETIATVSSEGIVTTLDKGTVTIKAEAANNLEVYGTLDINVVMENPNNTYYVDDDFTNLENPLTKVDGKDVYMGINGFVNIPEALTALEGINGVKTIKVLSGIYNDSFTIALSNINIVGPNGSLNPIKDTRVEEAIIGGVITIGDDETEYKNISISGLKFTGEAKVVTTEEKSVDGFVFKNNVVEDISYVTTERVGFIQFISTETEKGAKNVEITNNYMNNIYNVDTALVYVRPIWIAYGSDITISDNVITNFERDIYIEESMGDVLIARNNLENTKYRFFHIVSFLGGSVTITENNLYNSANTAIAIWGSLEYEAGMTIKVTHNTIDTVAKAIYIDPEYKNAEGKWVADKEFTAKANYNILKNVTGYWGYGSDEFPVDFTKNYWGTDTPETNQADKFFNLSKYDWGNYYTSEEDVPTPSEVSEVTPTDITINNPIGSMVIGETYQLDIDYSPVGTTNRRVSWSSSDPTILKVSADGLLTALKGGSVTITVTSLDEANISDTLDITIFTEPGIELTPSKNINSVLVGETVTITAVPYPNTEVNRSVSWTSSDEAIATVDQDGVVTTISAGTVTITASFADDSTIKTSITLSIYDGLDSNNLLDLLTMNQVIDSEIYNFTAIGYQGNYAHTTYESTSSYYYGDIPVIESIIAINQTTRSGRLMEDIPDGYTSYNDDNIYWVVVHDTASTSATANAASHNIWLTNMSNDPNNGTYVSWHYTVDEKEIYQNMPDNERAYHAGDGSNLVGEGDYIGGGNTNGIGIEMAVNSGSDIYRTWQKTAKLVASLLVKHNLPLENYKYHNDFSGKDCPNTLRNSGGLISNFEKMVAIEYEIALNHSDATITMTSNNPEYLDNTGRIIKMPLVPMTVSYDVTVTEDGVTQTRTFYTYLPGLLS